MKKLLIITFVVALLTACAVPVSYDRNEKTVFVTHATFDSNLGGLKGADDKCHAEADDPASVVPSGTYLAWLSDGTDSPNTRFIKSSDPYVLPNGTKIAESYTDLTDGSLLNPINLGPDGKPVGYQPFWTGTNPDGSTVRVDAYNGTCGGWAADPPAGKYGVNGHTVKNAGSWTYDHGYLCHKTLKLACFQQ